MIEMIVRIERLDVEVERERERERQ